MTRIAVSVNTADLDAAVEHRFGRSSYLLLVDSETMEWEAVDNPGREAGGGAGMQAARLLRDLRVEAVAGGEFGPNANNALRAANIETYRCGPGMTAREAVERLGQGDLSRVPSGSGEPGGRGTPDRGERPPAR